MITRRTMVRTLPAAGMALGIPFAHSAQVQPPRNAVVTPYYDPLQLFKTVLNVGLRQIPEFGWLVSTVVTLLWPSDKPDLWPEVRRQVEELADHKIDGAVFSLLKAKLDGLGDVLKLYLRAVQTKDVAQIRQQFVASHTEFVAAAPAFQNPDYQWVIAPLSGMFATTHMALLRDCVLNGEGWGWSRAVYDDMVRQCADRLASYTRYLQKVTGDEKARYDKSAPTSPGQHRTAIYDHYQPFHMSQTLFIDDFLLLLKYLDPIGHPGKVADIPFKDVYSPAYGTADDWDSACQAMSGDGGVAAQYSRPLSSFSSIYVEYFNFTPRVVDVAYPTGKGPEQRTREGRVDQYGIISYVKRGVEKATIPFPQPAPGKRFNVTKVHIRSASIPLDVGLELDDGRIFILWTRRDLPGGTKAEVAVPGRMLSTLNMWSRSNFYDYDLGCILFGFSVDTDFIPDPVSELFYIGAIDQPNLGARFLPTDVSRKLWQRRQSFWRDIAGRTRA